MRSVRRCHMLVVGCSALCSLVLVALWLVGGDGLDGGVLYRVASLGGLINVSSRHGIDCYFEEHQSTMQEISDAEPPLSTSIFFHETSCPSSPSEGIALNPRQACAVESAAKLNPNSEVYVLFASPRADGNASRIVQQLLSYENVHLMRVNFERYIVDSPLEKWYRGGALKASRWPRSHASDVLRFLTLWKYGGTYLDLDVVLTKTLEGLSNFAGAESALDVAAGVLNFAADGRGKEMATACLNDLRVEFRGDDWGNNGPGVITRVLKQTCKAKHVRDMTVENCSGFTVFPPTAFYPIPWRQWRLYFDEKLSERTMARVADSHAIHVWNKFSTADNVTVGSRQPYGLIAAKNCPRVYQNCGPIF